jgi:hypothetical protein
MPNLRRTTLLATLCFAANCFPALFASDAARPTGTPQDVLTYHNDTLRTGWFANEAVLNAGNVNSQSFGLLQVVTLDARVDAEPLVALQQAIQHQGTHNVAYVATENNSVYAIDADSGAILWQRNFGAAVPYSYKNYDDNVYPIMGILGTPVIDRTAGALYVVSDVYNGTSDTFYLHAISLSSGANLVKATPIHFSEKLASGSYWNFNSRYHLQRPGLLESNGYIYVSFGSNGDTQPNISRGNITRYDTATLTQASTQVTNTLATPASAYYLSSIWQSGYGPAADSNGDIYFSTGNSNPSRPSYSKAFNRPDSIVHLSGDLSTLLDSFTTYNYFNLDQGDVDMGSGGTLVLPDQAGSIPHLVVAGGKDGRGFLLNRDNLGGFTFNGPDNVLQTFSNGGCWCGPAYYVGADGRPRVVTGGGNGVTSWILETSPSPQLVQESSTGSGPADGLPDYGGTIPVISSNGSAPGSAVVWFVQRPATSSDSDPGTPVTLMAYSATNLTQPIFTAQAGTWVHAVNSNANIVPTVANGKVYVASNMQLQIFGLLQANAKRAVLPRQLIPSKPDSVNCPPAISPTAAFGGKSAEHAFFGNVCRVDGAQLQVTLRSGHSVVVDMNGLHGFQPPLVFSPGRSIRVQATIDGKGLAHASRVSRAHMLSPLTPADR